MSDVDPPRLTDPSSGAPDELRALFDRAQRDLPSQAELARLSSKLGPLLDPTGGTPPSGGLTGTGMAKLAAVTGALVGGALLVASITDEVPRDAGETRPAPSAVQTVAAPEPVRAPEPPRAEPATSLPSVAPSAPLAPAAEAPARAPEKRSSAEVEVELLERARRSLAGNPSHALALTTEHKLRFPGGVLAQEREVIAIDALRRLGRDDQARLRSDEFSKNYPGSAHRHKLDAGAAR